MTNKNNFQKNDQHPVNGIDMKTLEKLGRWLCIEFYRDPRELQKIIGVHGTEEIFSAIIQLDPAFGELLAGGYRFNQFVTVQRAGSESVKWSRLGEVVRPGQPSIDGIGDVRAKEVLMYIAVAERFIECDAIKRLFYLN